jgi:hypothetical protein
VGSEHQKRVARRELEICQEIVAGIVPRRVRGDARSDGAQRLEMVVGGDEPVEIGTLGGSDQLAKVFEGSWRADPGGAIGALLVEATDDGGRVERQVADHEAGRS